MFTRGPYRRNVLALLLATLVSCVGCNAFRETIPANCFPSTQRSIPARADGRSTMPCCGKSRPRCMRLGAGDILGIYIEGVLGKIDESPPITQGWHPVYSGGGGQPVGGGTTLPPSGSRSRSAKTARSPCRWRSRLNWLGLPWPRRRKRSGKSTRCGEESYCPDGIASSSP